MSRSCAIVSRANGFRWFTKITIACVPPFVARHVVTPHSVVTTHLIDQAGQPPLAARDEILAFFRQRLLA